VELEIFGAWPQVAVNVAATERGVRFSNNRFEWVTHGGQADGLINRKTTGADLLVSLDLLLGTHSDIRAVSGRRTERELDLKRKVACRTLPI
jgi:hypothetical protein